MIAGFRGETEADFEQTLTLLDEVEYDPVFSFKYSPRPKTAAGDWPDDVPEDEKGRRLGELQERQRADSVEAQSGAGGHANSKCWWKATSRGLAKPWAGPPAIGWSIFTVSRMELAAI